MLNEFIELTGFQPIGEYYHSVIEPEYEKSNLDKREWCKNWLKAGGIQKAYNELADTYKMAYDANIKAAEKEDAHWFIDMSDKYSAPDLRLRAIGILGVKPYLKYKLENGLNLWEEDRKLLINELDLERD